MEEEDLTGCKFEALGRIWTVTERHAVAAAWRVRDESDIAAEMRDKYEVPAQQPTPSPRFGGWPAISPPQWVGGFMSWRRR